MQLKITALLTLAALVAAVARQFTALEPGGLFTKGHPLTYVLIIILAISAVVMFVLSNKTNKEPVNIKNMRIMPYGFGKTASFIMLAGFIIAAVGRFFSYADKPFAVQNFFMILLPVIAAFSFFSTALFFDTGKLKTSTPNIMIIPVFVTAVMLVVEYASSTQMSTPAQYGFTIIAQLVNTLFFLYFAKMLTGSACANRALLFSSCAAVINAAAYVAPLIRIIGTGSFTLAALVNVLGLATCVYAIAAVGFIVREQKKTAPDIFPEEPEEAESGEEEEGDEAESDE